MPRLCWKALQKRVNFPSGGGGEVVKIGDGFHHGVIDFSPRLKAGDS